MMTYNFDQPIDRWGTNSAKWDFMPYLKPGADEATLPMWIADMDFPCPPPVVQAVHERADRQIFGYSSYLSPRYFRAVCGWFQRRFGFYVNSRDVMMTRGVVDAIKTAILSLTRPGDGVVIQMPVYYPFFHTINETGRKVADSPLVNTDGYYTIDFDDLESKLADPANTLMVFCSPHNPVGRVWTEEELRRVGELCQKHGVPLVSDEIHWDFVRAGQRHVPIASLFPKWKDVITCTAPSKTFNLAGMYLSNIVVPNPEHRKRIEALGMSTSMANPLAIAATQAAYEQCDGWVDQLNAYLDGNFAFMSEFLQKRLPKAKFRVPEGTYLAWVDVSAYCGDTARLELDLVKDAGVMLECGDTFGPSGEGFLRINCACPRAQLEQALDRTCVYLSRVRPGDPLRPFPYDTPWEKGLSMRAGDGRKKVFLFLRYWGCTVCQLDMGAYRDAAADFAAKDADVYFFLQSDPALIAAQEPAPLPCPIVCDPERRIFELYAVRPALSFQRLASPGALGKMQAAAGAGIRGGREEGHPLQLPAALCFDGAGRCVYSRYGRDAGDLPSPEELLETL